MRRLGEVNLILLAWKNRFEVCSKLEKEIHFYVLTESQDDSMQNLVIDRTTNNISFQ